VRTLGIVTIVAGVLAAATITYVLLRAEPDTAMSWPALASLPACDGFDFPVGPPNGTGYHDNQPFGVNAHLGNDWDRDGGDDNDLAVGDPVYAIAAGRVEQAIDIHGDWGNVVRIVHACRVESLYAHLDRIDVAPGTIVRRGQRIGTIGTAHGVYFAHLHLELRDRPLPLGGGYDTDHTGYLDPTAYIRAHRP
jgi:murein DD-endopeptidase MepM/ murein hydrolase activator NlpD